MSKRQSSSVSYHQEGTMFYDYDNARLLHLLVRQRFNWPPLESRTAGDTKGRYEERGDRRRAATARRHFAEQ